MLAVIQRKLINFRNSSHQEKLRKVRQRLVKYLYDQPLIWFFIVICVCFEIVGFLLQKWVRIRVFTYYSSRFGEQGENMELYLRKKSLRAPTHKIREWDLFIGNGVANRVMLRIYRRYANILISSHWNAGIRRFISIFPQARINQKHELIAHQFHITVPTHSHAKFNENEKKQGADLLKKMGLSNKTSYVCVQARDQAYTKNLDSNHDFSYHSYRNSQISNYVAASEALTEKGLWVVRMGHHVETHFNSSNPKIIDYAQTYRSELGDLYLPANCKFFLGTNSGLTEIASWCFDRPIIFTNSAPLGQMTFRKGDLLIPKKYLLISENRFLSIREIISMKLDRIFDSKEFSNRGIDLIENTEQEIQDVALEMNDRIDGTWVSDPEDEELQDQFRKCWPKNHEITGYPTRIGAQFLRQNCYLLK